jgi:D-alanyl-D-alanine carboxypeptidase (penicillin-binding protein 5/6)
MDDCGIVLPSGVPAPPAGLPPESSWMIADLSSGAVLASQNPHGRYRPASVIKVLLAIVVLRELKLDTVVTGTQEDANVECSCVGIGAGGQYTVRQLLQGLILKSGNDAANALARQLGGVPETLRKMNTLAKDLGALDTRAATPSGLDGPGMSTSAYDTAVIFRAAMSNPDFAKILATNSIEFPGFPGKPQSFPVVNQESLLTTYPGALGGKYGYTDDARTTYVGGAERNGRRLLVVILRTDLRTPLAKQAASMLDYGFSAFSGGITPVGQLVDKGSNTPSPEPMGQAGLHHVSPAVKAAPVSANMSDAFGNWGGPLTAGAGVFVVFALVMWWRKRRAKLAAARRAASKFSDAL